MSSEQLKAFLDKAKTDDALKAKMNASPDAKSIANIAKAEGFSIDETDLSALKTEVDKISDAELETISGGAGCLEVMNSMYCTQKPPTEIKYLC